MNGTSTQNIRNPRQLKNQTTSNHSTIPNLATNWQQESNKGNNEPEIKKDNNNMKIDHKASFEYILTQSDLQYQYQLDTN